MNSMELEQLTKKLEERGEDLYNPDAWYTLAGELFHENQITVAEIAY